jgi:hypothetical protein
VAGIWLARQDRSRRPSRLIALILGPKALVLSVIVTYTSIALGILNMLLDWVR